MVKYGIDLGSRKVKLAKFNNNKLIKLKLLDTANFYRKFNNESTDKIFKYLGIKDEDEIVTTGYGRHLFKLRGLKTISELFAHTIGTAYQIKKDSFLLLDIGAQDCKVIKVEDKKIIDFITNDKCAASTGRFLENMAKVMGISIKELAMHYKNPVKISSTCAVFTESELIGKMSEGYKTDELSAGVNYCVYEKIIPLLEQFTSEILVITGGGGLNSGLKKIIKKNTDYKIIITPDNSQFTGAIGCCLSE